MSLTTVPQTNNQRPIVFRPFGNYALMPRYGGYTNSEKGDCPYEYPDVNNPKFNVSPSCCPDMAGVDVLGIGVNNKVLDYQFGSALDVPFCGVSMQNECGLMQGSATPASCEKCPCLDPGCASLGVSSPCCNYGYGRQANQPFGPYGGNRYGNIKWG